MDTCRFKRAESIIESSYYQIDAFYSDSVSATILLIACIQRESPSTWRTVSDEGRKGRSLSQIWLINQLITVYCFILAAVWCAKERTDSILSLNARIFNEVSEVWSRSCFKTSADTGTDCD